jgi:hypothetical protein
MPTSTSGGAGPARYSRVGPSHSSAGVLNASVRFEVGGYSSGHIQGPPAALRELAAALIDAANRADASAVPAPAMAEGVAP